MSQIFGKIRAQGELTVLTVLTLKFVAISCNLRNISTKHFPGSQHVLQRAGRDLVAKHGHVGPDFGDRFQDSRAGNGVEIDRVFRVAGFAVLEDDFRNVLGLHFFKLL